MGAEAVESLVEVVGAGTSVGIDDFHSDLEVLDEFPGHVVGEDTEEEEEVASQRQIACSWRRSDASSLMARDVRRMAIWPRSMRRR